MLSLVPHDGRRLVADTSIDLNDKEVYQKVEKINLNNRLSPWDVNVQSSGSDPYDIKSKDRETASDLDIRVRAHRSSRSQGVEPASPKYRMYLESKYWIIKGSQKSGFKITEECDREFPGS